MKIKFTHQMDIKRSLCFDRLFHPNLRFNLREKTSLIRHQQVTVWMLVDGKLAGETYGMRLDSIPETQDDEIPGCTRYRGHNAFYVCSTAIMPLYQGLGLSRVLKAYFLGCIREYPIIIGHAFEGASLRLVKSFGARIGRAYPNWSETGQTTYLYEITR